MNTHQTSEAIIFENASHVNFKMADIFQKRRHWRCKITSDSETKISFFNDGDLNFKMADMIGTIIYYEYTSICRRRNVSGPRRKPYVGGEYIYLSVVTYTTNNCKIPPKFILVAWSLRCRDFVFHCHVNVALDFDQCIPMLCKGRQNTVSVYL